MATTTTKQGDRYASALAEIDAKLSAAIATLQETQRLIRQRALDEAAEKVRRPLRAVGAEVKP